MASDVAAVQVIEEAAFADPWTADAFDAAIALDHMRFLIAEWTGGGASGGVAGYVVALLLGAEVEIANLAVSSSERGVGVGGALLDDVTAHAAASGCVALYLEVRDSNAAARALYHSRGFEVVGVRKRYYRHPVEDALVLKREIG